MKRNGYAKVGEMPPKEWARGMCWSVNSMLDLLGCAGVVDCQPTSQPETANVAFGHVLLKRQINVDLRNFAKWVQAQPCEGEASRDKILGMLERKFSSLLPTTNQQPTNNKRQ